MGALEEIERALEADDTELLGRAVEMLDDEPGALDPTLIERVSKRLRARRDFDHLLRVADIGIRRGVDGRLWKDLAQGLVERGAYTAAIAVTDLARKERDLGPGQVVDLLGVRGRIAKDLYLSSGDPAQLRRALNAYAEGYAAGDDRQRRWLGINAHALAQLAARHGVDVEVDPTTIESEVNLLRQARAAAETGDQWAIATELEAHLVVGLDVPADRIVEELSGADPFLLNSFLRQLQRVWELPPTDQAVATLAELLLRHGRADEVLLPTECEGYEKLFGGVRAIALDTYRKGLHVAKSVCRLVDGDHTVATGYVAAGEDLHPAWAERRVLITNEHVVPLPGRTRELGTFAAEQVSATFDAHDRADVGGFETVWQSVRTELDVTILVSEELDESPVEPLRSAPKLPVASPGEYVYVVGHAGGRGLQLSVRGNDLLDHDGRRLHYLAPTEGGSSGSPVFDKSWRLIGTHSRGSTLEALNGKQGSYKGNQGTTMLALQASLAERPPAP